MARSDVGPQHSLTMANEDYLEAIYRIAKENGNADAGEGIRSVEVAEKLNVSKASVNKALSTLKESGMVDQTRYGKVTLTPKGREYAQHVWMCHRVLRAFLADDLGVDPETADTEACLMEHALSMDTQRRWIEYMKKQGVTFEK